MSLIESLHEYVQNRRARVLCNHLLELLPLNAKVLDVGCGDGLLAYLLAQKRSDLEVRGIDVLERTHAHIRAKIFDGKIIPYSDASFDVVILVDVLHHTDDPMILLREAVRTVRKVIVIKDHTRNGFLAGPTLRFMDKVGNARYGVSMTYNYWNRQRWLEAFKELHLGISAWKADLALYPGPVNWIFGRSLHFIARLELYDAQIAIEPSRRGVS